MRRPRSKLLAVALRRGWLVVLVTIGVAVVASVASDNGPGRFTVESVVAVPSGASEEGPGDAGQARELAQTYLETIPEDGGAIFRVAKAVGRSTDLDAVAEDIEVIGNPETSVLRLRFEDSDSKRTLKGGRALLEAVTGPEPAARSVEPDSLVSVRQPRIVDQTSEGGVGAAIPIGIFLGLCLGLALVVAWERSDPRIDTAVELPPETGSPATALHDVKPGNVGALIGRWQRMAGEPSGNGARPDRSVALLAATSNSEELVGDAGARLAELSHDGGHALVLEGSGSAPANGVPRVVVATGGKPGGPKSGEAIAAGAELVVLAVAPGARVTELRATLGVLEQFGVRPAWALFVRR